MAVATIHIKKSLTAGSIQLTFLSLSLKATGVSHHRGEEEFQTFGFSLSRLPGYNEDSYLSRACKSFAPQHLVQGHLASTILIGIEIPILFRVPAHFEEEDSSPFTPNDQSCN